MTTMTVEFSANIWDLDPSMLMDSATGDGKGHESLISPPAHQVWKSWRWVKRKCRNLSSTKPTIPKQWFRWVNRSRDECVLQEIMTERSTEAPIHLSYASTENWPFALPRTSMEIFSIGIYVDKASKGPPRSSTKRNRSSKKLPISSATFNPVPVRLQPNYQAAVPMHK